LIMRMIIGPVSHLILGKGGHRAMIPLGLIEDYLIDVSIADRDSFTVR
jgi:hypothetical protein